jgi:PBP1b-binding outer membrane lipoprotein LpoB
MRAFRAIAGTSAILFLAGCSAAEQPATAVAVVAATPACANATTVQFIVDVKA